MVKNEHGIEIEEDYSFADNSFIAINLVKPNSKVLSAGCGAGREVEFLVKERNCKVVAIDNQEEMIELSKKREPNAEYHVASITEYMDKPESYDYILCLWNTMNYLTFQERLEFIDCCEHNLKIGGKLIIVSGDLSGSWRYFLHNIKYRDSYYYPHSQINKWFESTKSKLFINKINNSNLIIAEKHGRDRKD